MISDNESVSVCMFGSLLLQYAAIIKTIKIHRSMDFNNKYRLLFISEKYI